MVPPGQRPTRIRRVFGMTAIIAEYLQHTRARGADERADRHVDVSRPALVAVEAFLVARLRDDLA